MNDLNLPLFIRLFKYLFVHLLTLFFGTPPVLAEVHPPHAHRQSSVTSVRQSVTLPGSTCISWKALPLLTFNAMSGPLK